MSSEGRKLIISLKEGQRNMIMTDKNPTDSIEDLKSKLIKLMGSKKICAIQTQNDLLICRPSQLTAIMVSSKGEFEKIESSVEETDFLDEIEEDEDPEKSEYVDSLTFDEETEDDQD